MMTINSRELELFLARLYTDLRLYEDFIQQPELTMRRERLSEEVIAALQAIDIQGLKLAVKSYHHKRMQYKKQSVTFWQHIKRALRF
ncbi:MAG: hypothetical protein ABW044_06295 [Cellvibrio sp.]